MRDSQQLPLAGALASESIRVGADEPVSSDDVRVIRWQQISALAGIGGSHGDRQVGNPGSAVSILVPIKYLAIGVIGVGLLVRLDVAVTNRLDLGSSGPRTSRFRQPVVTIPSVVSADFGGSRAVASSTDVTTSSAPARDLLAPTSRGVAPQAGVLSTPKETVVQDRTFDYETVPPDEKAVPGALPSENSSARPLPPSMVRLSGSAVGSASGELAPKQEIVAPSAASDERLVPPVHELESRAEGPR